MPFVFGEVVESADVGMAEGRNRLGFAMESAPELFVGRKLGSNQLDGNDPVKSVVARAEDLAHTAMAQFGLEPIRPDLIAGTEAVRMRLSRHGTPILLDETCVGVA